MDEEKIEKKIEDKIENWAEKMDKKDCGKWKNNGNKFNHGTAGAVYGLGFIGAAVYYIGHADTFWVGVLGFLKALVWPAMIVYHLLEFLYQ